MTWGATAIVGGSLVSGYLGSQASDNQADIGRNQIAESRRQFDINRSDTEAQRRLGVSATNRMEQLLGGGEITSDMMGPGYNWRVGQGENALANMLNRTGMKRSGRAMKEMTRFGQGEASQEYGNYFSRLMQMAGFGASGAGQSAQAGSRVANSPGFQTQINAAGSGPSAINQAIQGGMSNYFAYQQNQQLLNSLNNSG